MSPSWRSETDAVYFSDTKLISSTVTLTMESYIIALVYRSPCFDLSRVVVHDTLRRHSCLSTAVLSLPLLVFLGFILSNFSVAGLPPRSESRNFPILRMYVVILRVYLLSSDAQFLP